MNMSTLRTHPDQNTVLSEQTIILVQEMFAGEAERVLGHLAGMDEGTRRIAIATIKNYNNALAANDNQFSIAAQA